MTTSATSLRDRDARIHALSRLDRSLLVEAGAGSGKTAVLAGRIVMLLVSGVAPSRIAAVTFTELAAGELLERVRQYVDRLLDGDVPRELSDALPGGLNAGQLENLTRAGDNIDDLLCSTIHGFCQRLINPYPVETNSDPGATIADAGRATLLLEETIDQWLRDQLSGEEEGFLAELVMADVARTLKLVRLIVDAEKDHRTLLPPEGEGALGALHAFTAAVNAFAAGYERSGVVEEKVAAFVEDLTSTCDALGDLHGILTPADWVRLLQTSPTKVVLTNAGTFRVLSAKTAWANASKAIGISKADADREFEGVQALYDACAEAWDSVHRLVACKVLAGLMAEVSPIAAAYRDRKRESAMLDFDDLLYTARDLLRDDGDVRRALAERYAHVLVDEFQDTDPLQAEILWRLCGDPPKSGAADRSSLPSEPEWARFTIRPGALFLVGDPKQAIYRFRGADVHTYVRARTALTTTDVDNLQVISTNFRSLPGILEFVNERFDEPLGAEGQPGFTALDSFHSTSDDGLQVAALDVVLPPEIEKPKVEDLRVAEANAIADLCARLIGSHQVIDRESQQRRLCRPGDIALLTPASTSLWRYEAALEKLGIPVATQAGKGFYRRQEVQDLVALCRTLADGRDTIALGALLRGPLVGLTEEELLDEVAALPRDGVEDGYLPRLSLNVPYDVITHPLLRDVFERLQSLRRRIHSTTPHDLLSQAVDVMHVRPLLVQRYGHRADRALANVDLFLDFARPYAIRGLRAFSTAMTKAWEDEEKTVEGRSDTRGEAVTLITMHSAKGLEWPVVVPVNTVGDPSFREDSFVDRQSGRFYCKVLGKAPAGYEEIKELERAEVGRERVRILYVATTRARELLVIPRLPDEAAGALRLSSWKGLVDLGLAELPALDVTQFPLGFDTAAGEALSTQTREQFVEEAAAIASRRRELKWLIPSRDEDPDGQVVREAESAGPFLGDAAGSIDDRVGSFIDSAEGAVPDLGDNRVVAVDSREGTEVRGSRLRGRVMHKLFEEVLTGETDDTLEALLSRAGELIASLDLSSGSRVSLSADELAGCVSRTLSHPVIAELRPSLEAELPVYAWREEDSVGVVTTGVADAVSYGPNGTPDVVVDWKSDVDPSPKTVEHYRAQVGQYVRALGAWRGFVVLATSGTVLEVGR